MADQPPGNAQVPPVAPTAPPGVTQAAVPAAPAAVATVAPAVPAVTTVSPAVATVSPAVATVFPEAPAGETVPPAAAEAQADTDIAPLTTAEEIELAEAPTLNIGEDQTLEDLIFNAQIIDQVTEVGEVQDTEQKATLSELHSVLLHPEEIPPGRREFASNLYNSFKICQSFMAVLGRLPIKSYQDELEAIVFEYDWTSYRGNLFFVTFALLLFITVASSINMISTMLNFPFQPDSYVTNWDAKVEINNGQVKVHWVTLIPGLNFPQMADTIRGRNTTTEKNSHLLRAEEMFYFRRNLASLIIVLFLLYHVLVSDWNLFGRRHFIASYLTFWTESVEIMKIDAAGDAKKYSRRFLVYYSIWYGLFMIALLLNFAPVATGAPTSFAFLWVRCVYPPVHALPDSVILTLQILGSLVYSYVVLCSKVYVFFFLFICKLLTTAFSVWNERLEKIFTVEHSLKKRKEKCASRTGYDHLFRDYVNLLDLLSGADTLFTNIVESYFGMTVMSIVFEVYYLIRPVSGNQQEFEQARTFDMVIIAMYIFNSIMVFYLVASGAAEVGESAANGLEIIRRQGILGHRSDEEMHFMISLYMSYTGHFETALSGGGYFILNKPFLISIAGGMLSYIIIIFQFQPALGLGNEEQKSLVGFGNSDPEDVVRYRSLILHVEKNFMYHKSREPGY